MSDVIQVITLGSVFSLIAVSFLLNFKYQKYWNLALIAYCTLGAQLVSNTFESIPTPVSVVIATLVIAIITWIVDYFLISPIASSAGAKTITSLAVLSILFVFIEAFYSGSDSNQKSISSSAISFLPFDLRNIEFITILIFVISVLGLYYFSYKTTLGKMARAFADDENMAIAHGVEKFLMSMIVSIVISFLCVISGVLISNTFANPFSFQDNLQMVSFYAVVAVAATIFARNSNFFLCILGAFIVALMQTLAVSNVSVINDVIETIKDIFLINSTFVISEEVIFVLVPFVVALLSLPFIPGKWVEHD